MKNILFLIISLSLVIHSNPVSAQDEKQIEKGVFYKGYIKSKIPEGHGTLSLRTEYKANTGFTIRKEIFDISGNFKDNLILFANIQNQLYAAEVEYEYNKKDKTICFKCRGLSNSWEGLSKVEMRDSLIITYKYNKPYWQLLEFSNEFSLVKIVKSGQHSYKKHLVCQANANNEKFTYTEKYNDLKFDDAVSEKWGRNIDLKTLSVDGERAYEESYGAIEQSNATSRNSANEGLMQPFPTVSQNTKYPQSLVGRAYHGIVKTSNAEYDKSYDCHYTIIFYSENRCRAMQHLTSKGTTRDIVELAAVSERSSESRDFEYSYNNGQLRIIDDSGSMLVQDNGGKIKMVDDQALHGDIYLVSDEITSNLLNVIGFNGSTCAYKIDVDRILHRNYKGEIVKSTLSKIEMLLKEDVAGYYDIPGISTEVQKKVFAQSEDYKNVYLPRLKKEKEYLLQDEFEAYFIISDTGCDVWELDYDMPSKRFHFELRHHEPDRYTISNENNAFHVLIKEHDIPYCLTYPKSLVSVVNGRSRNGKMGQEQTLFTCVIPETEAAQFYPNRHNTLLWRFNIEKIKNGRLYGTSTGLKVIEGTPDGTDILGVPRYRYVTLKEQAHKVVLDLSNTFSQKGNTFRSVKNAK